MRRNIILNIIFFVLFIVCLVLSFMIDFFFFIPIICFIPFTLRAKKFNEINYKENKVDRTKYGKISVRYCSNCGGKITEPIAKFCYHCGEPLNNI